MLKSTNICRQTLKRLPVVSINPNNGGISNLKNAKSIVRSYSTANLSSQVQNVELKSREQAVVDKTTTISTSINFGDKSSGKSDYSKNIKLSDNKSIVLVKIGGGVIEDNMSALIQSLNFLKKIGLYPIVVHGGGPQMNAELTAAGVEPEYVEGLRVTRPQVLAIAQRVFMRENLKIVEALEASGTKARPITQGVFQATPLDPSTYGFVGNVTKILTDGLASCIGSDYIPVISSLAMTEHGQVLNINADVAALELAKAIRPLKILFINTTAGMKDGDGKVMRHIVLDQQYDNLMKQPWVKHGTKLKLKEFKNCLDNLPLSTSITITSPELLQKELFTKSGSGTTVEKGISILTEESQLDFGRLSKSFGLRPAELKSLVEREKLKIIVNSIYTSAIVLRSLPSSPSTYVVDRFVVDSGSIEDESADSVFQAALAKYQTLVWKADSATTNAQTTAWFRKIADGFTKESGFDVYWNNIPLQDVARPIAMCLAHRSPITAAAETAASQAAANLIQAKKDKYRIGLLGARGFTGGHLVRLIGNNPSLELTLAASSTNYGKPVTTEFPHLKSDLLFSQVTAENIDKYTEDSGIDGWFMALPDQISKPYVEGIDRLAKQPVLVDLSADHRFNNSWTYGNPETNRANIIKSKRIANPGCYATGMYLTLYPLRKAGLLDGEPSCFGISGYSGAGSKPSEKNDLNRLRDNILPYKLVKHTHELEVSHQLSQPIYFMPHVGQFFQGITLTISIRLTRPLTKEEVVQLYTKQYQNEPLVKIDVDGIPEVRANANKHTLTIGGFAVNGNHLVVVTTLDNLLKGAATQALQNMNLCLGIEELEGIKKEL
ncbi:acetylglutamate kinase [Heterostelium album PN500]|uniref:Acetylglutamate kinase n=1 Tax=Heterostelium pallidum (strain ATCC 26659 / Pp 5 / PN500) TaxID=670386 RepID=D3BGC4_HETP5|nr:acetylglutamate kinase [Heterostelium album PN500]EFA79524.1 acetylglutamate kinase [Heterostelium album PN500]|eukprot:XP_020431645.1 acetylglutamate kinase [Heterostelium album PN500]